MSPYISEEFSVPVVECIANMRDLTKPTWRFRWIGTKKFHHLGKKLLKNLFCTAIFV
jgi:hypothetical protein